MPLGGYRGAGGMWVGHVKHCTRNTLKVKKSKIKDTRPFDVVSQNIEYIQ